MSGPYRRFARLRLVQRRSVLLRVSRGPVNLIMPYIAVRYIAVFFDARQEGSGNAPNSPFSAGGETNARPATLQALSYDQDFILASLDPSVR